MRLRTLVIAATVVTVAATALAFPVAFAEPASATGSALRDDFNGDGYADLVVGTPKADVDGKARAGNVVVTYGSTSGVSPSRSAVLSQNSPGIPGAAELGDGFGDEWASGDLDGDGYADLVIGSYMEDISGVVNAGMVTVVWGGPGGLSGGTSVLHPAADGTLFGRGIAVGDFDGNGRDDLAVTGSSGTTRQLWLYDGGFTRTGPATAPREVPGVFAGPSYGVVGATAGDMTGDGRDDVIVYGSDTGDSISFTSYVQGTPGGLIARGDLDAGRTTTPTKGAAAIGDVDHDGFADLVTGEPVPVRDGQVGSGPGSITVRYGSAEGPGAVRPLVTLDQDTPGIPGANESGDRFGTTVAVGDVTSDGYADVAVGAPYEDISTHTNVGNIVLLKGGVNGLTTSGAQSFHQATSGVPGAAESGDHFGDSLHIADVSGNGKADAAIGASGEGVTPGGYEDGAVWVLRGSASGLTTNYATSFSAPSFGFTFVDRKFGSVLSD